MRPSTPVVVVQLVGSAESEDLAELSRLYAGASLSALNDPVRYAMHVAYVSPDRSWRFPADLSAAALASAPPVGLAGAIDHLETLGIDVVVPQMFCIPGMTTYRALLEVLGLPYLGNPPEVMAIAADKAKARAIVGAAGIAVPAGELVRAGARGSPGLPVVVKPVCSDNSEGVSLVREQYEYDAAVDLALTFGDVALVESYVQLGREVRCGIVVRDGEMVCLPLEEYAVDRELNPIRRRSDKLSRTDDGELYLVAKDPARAWIVADDDLVVERVHEAARRCHVALGCRHYSLFDFRIDPEGNPWFLEAGPYCSYAPTSVIAVMAASAGWGLSDLLAIGLGELDRERAPLCDPPN